VTVVASKFQGEGWDVKRKWGKEREKGRNGKEELVELEGQGWRRELKDG
jgi:hypothetical protein